MEIDVVCLGEVVVDLVARGEKEEHFPGSFSPVPGGAAVNVAIALKRLGVQSALMGKVGKDVFGRFLVNALAGEQVNLEGLALGEKDPTALTFVFRRDWRSREPFFVRYGAADMNFQRDDVCWSLLSRTKVLHFVSLCLVQEPLRRVTWEILEFCVRRGIFLSFDVNHRPGLWQNSDEARELILQAVQGVDFLKLTLEELYFLTGKRDPQEGAAVLLSRGAKNCVITLGENGAFFASSLGQGLVPAFPVDAVDPVGCGDAFCAGFLKEMLSEETQSGNTLLPERFHRMVRFASACGALAARAWGAAPGFPTLDEVEQFFEKACCAQVPDLLHHDDRIV